jgi:DNA-binding NarL/FixJ family response regulator
MRIVLAEDLLLLRDGLARLFEAHGFDVVASVEDGGDLLDAIVECRPDIAVIDVRLPPTYTDEGLQAALKARRHIPGMPVLILSQYVEQLYARELLADASGGVGYLLKDRVSDVEQFIDAVERVAAGGTAMDADVISQLLGRRTRDKPLRRLSSREREVLAHIAEGRSNGAIAQHLVVSESAIAKHISNIFTKLDLAQCNDNNRRVLAVLAYLEK